MLKKHRSITDPLQENSEAARALLAVSAKGNSARLNKNAKHSANIKRALLTTCLVCLTSTSQAASFSGNKTATLEKDDAASHAQHAQDNAHKHNKSSAHKNKHKGHKTGMYQHTKQKQHHANTVNRLSNDGLPSVYYKGTAFNFFGDVDFHYAFSNNDDEFQAKRYNREHYMATTYSIGGEFDYALNADTRVGAIIALGASKDKRYAMDIIDAQNNAVMQQANVAITARGNSERPYVDNEVSNFAYPVEPVQQGSASVGGGPGGGGATAPISGTATLTAYGKQLATLDSAGATTISVKTSGATTLSATVNTSSLTFTPTAYSATSYGSAVGSVTVSGIGGILAAVSGTSSAAGLSAANPALTYASGATPSAVTPTVTTNVTQPTVTLSGTATGTFATSGATQYKIVTLADGVTAVPVVTGVSGTPANATVVGWDPAGTVSIEAHDLPDIGYNVSVPAAGLTATATNAAVTATFNATAAGASGLLGFSGAAPAPAGAPIIDLAKLEFLQPSGIVVTLPDLVSGSATAVGGSAAVSATIPDGTTIALLGTMQDIAVGLSDGTTDVGDTSGTSTTLSIPISGTVTINTSGMTVNASLPGLASAFNDVARLDAAKATLLHSHLERASVYVESKFGRFEAGREDGPEVKLRHDAASIARATGGINGSWYHYANLGGVVGPSLNSYGLQSLFLEGFYQNTDEEPVYGMSFTDFFYHPASYLEFHLENAPKISYYTPDFGGFRIGVSYIMEQADDNPYVRFSNKYSDSYHNIFTGAAEYSFNVSDIDFNAGFFGEFAKHNDHCAITYSNSNHVFSDQCVKNYQDLQTFGLGGKVSFAGFSVAGSFVNMTDSGQKRDLTWNPDWYASFSKPNSIGDSSVITSDDIYNTRSALYSKSERPESKRGIPDKISIDQLALVQVKHSVHGTTGVYTYNSSGTQSVGSSPIAADATGGIVLNADGSIALEKNIFAAGPSNATPATLVDLKITPADTEDDSSGTHDSYYWTVGVGYEMGPAGFSVTYMDSRTQQKDAWGGRSKLRNVVAGLDYEIAKGFVPYIEVAFFKTEDRTYGFIDLDDTASGLSSSDYEAVQDTLFGKLYGNSIYPYYSTDPAYDIQATKKSIVDENTGYTVMVGAKMSF